MDAERWRQVKEILQEVRELPPEERDVYLRDSAINLDHVQTVDKARLKRFIRSVSREKMAAVCRDLNIAAGCAHQ